MGRTSCSRKSIGKSKSVVSIDKQDYRLPEEDMVHSYAAKVLKHHTESSQNRYVKSMKAGMPIPSASEFTCKNHEQHKNL